MRWSRALAAVSAMPFRCDRSGDDCWPSSGITDASTGTSESEGAEGGNSNTNRRTKDCTWFRSNCEAHVSNPSAQASSARPPTNKEATAGEEKKPCSSRTA
mmetsp:Transcript_48445/g.95032  ORF Transcript_48445/g.95032 Transcript_48445/m.95032 type:complete len:101 (+) Transcript_48445:696-998(+)